MGVDWWDWIRYLVLLCAKNYDAIYNRIRHFIGQKSDITYVSSHDYAKVKIDS